MVKIALSESQRNEKKKELGDKAWETEGKGERFTMNNFKRAVRDYRQKTSDSNDKLTNQILQWLILEDIKIQQLWKFEKD